MQRNSKKWYFSRYSSIQIPLLFSFSVTVVLTSSQEVCYVGAWAWLWRNSIYNSERSDFIISSRAKCARSLLTARGLSQLQNSMRHKYIFSWTYAWYPSMTSWSRAFRVSRQHRLLPPFTKAHFVFIHRLWNKVYHRWITNNFPCKWLKSTTSGSKSSPRTIFHRNSPGARTPTSNSAWTTKEKTYAYGQFLARGAVLAYEGGSIL